MIKAAWRILLIGWLGLACGCGGATSEPQAASLAARAVRRAFPGAPPVIPHKPQSSACVACHTPTGSVVPVLGVAPANPHLETAGMSDRSRCTQCHVFQNARDVFAANDFPAVATTRRRGERAHPLAPPTMPHGLFMRENCQACHTGLAARKEILCRHPERTRCVQCHVAQENPTVAAGEFTPIALP